MKLLKHQVPVIPLGVFPIGAQGRPRGLGPPTLAPTASVRISQACSGRRSNIELLIIKTRLQHPSMLPRYRVLRMIRHTLLHLDTICTSDSSLHSSTKTWLMYVAYPQQAQPLTYARHPHPTKSSTQPQLWYDGLYGYTRCGVVIHPAVRNPYR